MKINILISNLLVIICLNMSVKIQYLIFIYRYNDLLIVRSKTRYKFYRYHAYY